jgi:pyruvate dehydrogenase E1 component
VAVPWALAAQRLLTQDWGVAAEVWSVTSWEELRRDGVECDRHNLRDPQAEPRVPHLRRVLGPESEAEEPIPVVGVSDWMRAVPDLIRPWVPGPFTSLGTDGFGFSDTRPAARRYFGVDAESITVAALAALAERGTVDRRVISEAAEKYQVADLP